MKKWVFLAALALALSPSSARADWLFTPNLGTTFGGATNGREHFTYGVGFGWMGNGILGWEADLSYTPEFFEGNDNEFDFIDESNVVGAMLNIIVGAPIGGQFGPGFRPYFTTGMGMLQREVESDDDLFNMNSNDWGFNVGAGAMGFVTDKRRLPRRHPVHPIVPGSRRQLRRERLRLLARDGRPDVPVVKKPGG